jgi:hypothetical protein
MTNDEALRLIKATRYCWVAWAVRENDVSAVYPSAHETSGDERARELEDIFRQSSERVRVQFLISANVTMETLRQEQAKGIEVAERVRIFGSWQTTATDDLLVLLETGEFRAPMDLFHGSSHIIDQIYYGRSASLSSRQVERLNSVASKSFFSPLGSAVVDKLECCLAVIQNDQERLERFWRLRLAKKNRAFNSDFAVAAGDIALSLPDVVIHFVSTVATQLMFGPRCAAMLALGKIGAAAGDVAASTITEHIYDSSESIAALRDRVVSRIQTPPSMWKTCEACVRGKTPVVEEGMPWFRDCAHCFGLGHIRV